MGGAAKCGPANALRVDSETRYPSTVPCIHPFPPILSWANVGYHRANAHPEWVTPNIGAPRVVAGASGLMRTRQDNIQWPNSRTADELVATGIELDRNYAFQYCSPSRSALQSGRNPIHVK